MAAYSTYADQELAALLKQGDHLAFTEIYDRYWSVLYLHARHRLRDEELARDVIQDVFSGIWNRYEQLEFSISLNAYLYRSVRNAIINMIRHERVKENYLADLGAFSDREQVQTDELVRYNELKRLIEKEILSMPPGMREVFELSRNQGLSHAEIGAQLGISALTAKKQVSKVVSLLRKKFKIPLATLIMLLRVLP
jgi:RNA polymerase sigma-70 factor (ECF subfamily)